MGSAVETVESAMKARRFLTTAFTTTLIATGVAVPAATAETYTPTVKRRG